jgi:hypothetical protein
MQRENAVESSNDNETIPRTRTGSNRRTNIVSTINKFVDEATATMTPRQQRNQDAHLLYDYILPVPQQHVDYL